MKFSCKAEVEQAVAEYVHFYNFERINLKNGLTSFEIRSKAAYLIIFCDRVLFSCPFIWVRSKGLPLRGKFFVYLLCVRPFGDGFGIVFVDDREQGFGTALFRVVARGEIGVVFAHHVDEFLVVRTDLVVVADVKDE